MTICIAALYDNGKGCILASDQMTTAHFPIGYKFESEEVGKIVRIKDSVAIYSLVSGDILFANQVLEIARQKINAEGIKLTASVAELVRSSYQQARLLRIIQNELEPRGLDLQTYYQQHQRLLPQVVQMIDTAFKTYHPMVDLIVAGKDESTCRIFTIMNPGGLICNDPIGYAAIGTGAPHAIYSLMESNYKRSLDKEAVNQLVKQAKKRSEVAPGVGKETTTIEL